MFDFVSLLNSVRGLALVAMLAALSACAGIEDPGSGPRAPNYASPLGNNDWEVSCGRQSVFIDDSALDEFYNEDGSRKTYMEFCAEAEPSLIRQD